MAPEYSSIVCHRDLANCINSCFVFWSLEKFAPFRQAVISVVLGHGGAGMWDDLTMLLLRRCDHGFPHVRISIAF